MVPSACGRSTLDPHHMVWIPRARLAAYIVGQHEGMKEEMPFHPDGTLEVFKILFSSSASG